MNTLTNTRTINLTAEQLETITTALYGLTHCNGYREGQGWNWAAQRVYAIVDTLGITPAVVFDGAPNHDVDYCDHRGLCLCRNR